MQIALSSAPVKNKDIPHNLAAMTAALAQAAADGADLVVFGESTLQGFDCLCWSYAADRDMALPLDSAPIRQLQDAARKYATAISFGFIERDGDALYSSCAFIGADGEIIHRFRRVSIGWKDYRKTDAHYREGTHFEKFTYGGKPSPSGCAATSGRTADPKKCTHSTPMWCSGPSGATTAPMNGTAPSSTNTRNRRKSAAGVCCSSIPTVRMIMPMMLRRAGQLTSATAKFRRNCPRETAGC